MVATFPFSNSTAVTTDPIADFASRLRGELILPENVNYDEARKLWNAEFDRRPTLIVRVADEFDVIACVHFARNNNLPITVRGGGHSFAGFSMINGGLVVDTTKMKSLHIDPVKRVSRAQSGLTWGEYAEKAQEFGLATTSGDAPTTGVAGLTAGGGIGWFVRKHGLSVDNLLSVEMVTADGRLVRASYEENQDLFWAVRGGGSNFGIITSLEFKLHDAGIIVGGAMIYSGDELDTVIRNWRDTMTAAPDDLTTIMFITTAPPLPFLPEEHHGKLIVLLLACYAGDIEEGMKAVEPLRSLGTPVVDMLGPVPYTALYEIVKDATVAGNHHGLRSGFLQEMPDDLIDTITKHSRAVTSPINLIQLRSLGGQMGRVSSDATAFAHRDAKWMFIASAAFFPEDKANRQVHRDWMENFWQAVQPQTKGVYVNFLEEEGEARKRSAYNEQNLARLAEIKAQYDPTNFFRANQNIAPAKR